MKSLSRALFMAAIVLAAGCSLFRPQANCQKPQDYEASKSIPRLHVPPGMDAPDTRDALVIPEVTAPEAPRTGGCLDEPPSYRGDQAAPAPARRPGKH
jgi:uncharacterized lipoprotein